MNDTKKAKEALTQIRLKINQAMQAHRDNIKKLRADEREALRYYAKLTSKKMGIRYTQNEMSEVLKMTEDGIHPEKIAFQMGFTTARVRRMIYRHQIIERCKK